MRVLASPRYKADNPFPQRLYDAVDAVGEDHNIVQFSLTRLFLGRWTLWHLHWPESVLWTPSPLRAWLRFARFWLALRVAKLRGLRLVWTVHNLKSHESTHPRLERLLWRSLLARLDGLICLTRAGRDQVLARHPAARTLPAFVIPHGHYRGLYADEHDAAAARRQLGLDPHQPVAAFVGQIRDYKNVPALVEAFRAAPDEDWRLLVAGRPLTPDLAKDLRTAAADDARIALHLEFVAPDALQRYFRAADLVVLPFKEILNSGSAILALSFDRPVLVPNRGAMAELRDLVGEDWVMVYDGSLDTTVLRRAMDWARNTHRGTEAPLQGLDWSVIGTRTLAAYRALLEDRPEPPA